MNDRDDIAEQRAEYTGTLVDGIDFYFEDGLMVLTKKFLLARGYCCDNDCRHCPYREARTVTAGK